jgi:hypothetical protein
MVVIDVLHFSFTRHNHSLITHYISFRKSYYHIITPGRKYFLYTHKNLSEYLGIVIFSEMISLSFHQSFSVRLILIFSCTKFGIDLLFLLNRNIFLASLFLIKLIIIFWRLGNLCATKDILGGCLIGSCCWQLRISK